MPRTARIPMLLASCALWGLGCGARYARDVPCFGGGEKGAVVHHRVRGLFLMRWGMVVGWCYRLSPVSVIMGIHLDSLRGLGCLVALYPIPCVGDGRCWLYLLPSMAGMIRIRT